MGCGDSSRIHEFNQRQELLRWAGQWVSPVLSCGWKQRYRQTVSFCTHHLPMTQSCVQWCFSSNMILVVYRPLGLPTRCGAVHTFACHQCTQHIRTELTIVR
jgi:hypothetical protein